MKTNILTLAITLALGVILAGSLLVPIIEDTQTNIGPSVTLDNAAYPVENYKYTIWDGSDITLSYVASPDISTAGVYSVNGEAVTLQGTAQRIIIASNDFASRSGGTVVPVLNTQYVESTAQLGNAAFTFTVVDKAYTLEITSGGTTNTYTGVVDWLVYATEDGTAGLIQSLYTTSPFYTSNTDDIIVLGNIYTTGDNDTFYSYYKGQLTVNEAYADESSVSITKTAVSGYTDIYNTQIEVNVGDETFSPFFILIPEKVTGHEISDYDALLGAIPVLVIVGLVLVGVGAIFVKRND